MGHHARGPQHAGAAHGEERLVHSARQQGLGRLAPSRPASIWPATLGRVSDRAADYDYEVPPAAIAQVPAAQREDARLLRVPRGAVERGAAPGWLRDASVRDLPALLRPGDLLVLNETRVRPARLLARRATGGRVSVLVLDVMSSGRAARVLLGARGTLLPGEHLALAGDTWRVAAALGEGRFDVEVEQGRDVSALLADIGRMPLPPYIERGEEDDPRDALDRERYQTTFARPGVSEAAAAPTAGLHLTPALLDAISARGIEVVRLSLAVGEGTFRPLRGESLDEHVMHAERYEVPADVAQRFAAARAEGRRVLAVGTTVVRALESAAADDGRTLRAGSAETTLFIRPGQGFRAVDALLTNFHQPRSTLLVLVSAFAGLATVRAAYAHALGSGYRLFSYGDAMLLE
jgi:S-adenosylmethionine:tRNA ribosyltransferase-isomerase